MNIVNKVTTRNLIKNKKRTIITIIGVIISVAMVTAVTTLGTSFMDLFKRQTIANSGEWHVLYEDVNKAQLEAIQSDEVNKTTIISRDVGYAQLVGGQNRNKPYLFIKEFNSAGFKQFPIELSEGRLPQSDSEIVISEEISGNGKVDYEIGDRVTLLVGERVSDKSEAAFFGQNTPLQKDEDGAVIEKLENVTSKSYTIVGTIKRPIWEPTWAPGYTVLSYVDEDLIGKSDIVQASVVLKSVNSRLFSHAEEFANRHQIDSVQFNDELLRYYGVIKDDGFRMTLFSLSAVIMLVIIVGSVSLIYNAFAISVSERSRHLGMLASVGATKRQKRNSVLFEGMVIGLISIPIGILSGLVGIGITFSFINSMIQGVLGVTEQLTVTMSPLSIILACLISIFTIFISAYIPAKRASKISAIDAIRQTADVKLTGKTVKTSRLIRKLFGIEAEIGLKNLKRNKRRYQATVFSLVISIVLFLAVSFFTDNLKKSAGLTQDGINFDIEVSVGNGKQEEVETLLKSITSLEDVTESSTITTFPAASWIDKDLLAEQLKNIVDRDNSALENGKYPLAVNIQALDNQSLQEYAEKIGADYEQLRDRQKLSAIVVDTTIYEDYEARKFVETKLVETEVGHNLDLHYTDRETGEEKPLATVEIAALTDEVPMGVGQSGIGSIHMIVSKEALNEITGSEHAAETYTQVFLKSIDPMGTQQDIEEMENTMSSGHLSVYNVYQQRQQEEQMILILSVFTYGFIILITAISVANIFNTISTSISLRKREFAMLKSVGMTPKGFNKMINYESIFYGVKAVLYGIPISIAVMYMIHRSLMGTFSYSFTIPLDSLVYAVSAVFVIVSAAMLYSSAKVKKENIIDALKQENI
ncbi:ABC transporter permease [Bacillus litorisediminis]|uniref:ABC transporter permease n=1 Tax=Bacillus litorisediminis TaxID=2922713 RepID=UPI001FABED41|nr:ABC transporter permease [Bacillus litorisediminis]